MRALLLLPLIASSLAACPLLQDTVPPSSEGEGEEGEGDALPSEGEGDIVVGEGEGDVVGEGEGDIGEGEGDIVVGEGEGDVVVGEGEGDVIAGEGEGEVVVDLVEADVIAAFRADADAATARFERETGFPIALADGSFLFISFDGTRTRFAGDVDNFQPENMNIERDGNNAFAFAWITKAAAPGSRYKFVDDNRIFVADENARAYSFDGNGEMSLTSVAGVNRVDYPKLYARHFNVDLPADIDVGDALLPRNVRVLVPLLAPTRVLYVHDGQNVFDRDSSIPDGFVIPDGGWQLDHSVPDDTMIVAIDNTPERFFDYTHVPEPRSTFGGGFGEDIGGGADLYADLVELVVRPLVADVYGEPPIVGVMGSSLGGLVSFIIADRYPGEFDFAAGLSSSFGWGSFDNPTPNDGDDTLIDVYAGKGVRSTVLYLDSGGDGGSGCADSDGDGINDDDGEADDNFCETVQMRDTLQGEGYVEGANLFYVYDAGPSGNGDASHTESAWRFRSATEIFPLFSSLR